MKNLDIKHVKIGPFTYDVKFVKDLKKPTGEKVGGSNSTKKMLIQIESQAHPRFQLRILLHEVIELMGYVSGLKRKILTKQKLSMHEIASHLDVTLYQVLKDNPDLISLIGGEG